MLFCLNVAGDEKFESSKNIKIIPSFEKMGLNENLYKGIIAYGNVQGFLIFELVLF